MSFLAMIIAVLLLQLRDQEGQLFHDNWPARIHSTFLGLGLPASTSVLFTIIAPVLAVVVVLGLLEPILFGLLWIGASAAILLYCFGPGDFQALLDRYTAYCRSGNYESAWLEAQTDLSTTTVSPADPDSTEEFLLQLQGQLLYEAYLRWFAVLFYFVIFGPAGALAYRLLHLCKFPQLEDLTERLLFYADWLPLRLLAATFSVTGDFLRSRDELLAGFGPDSKTGVSILLATARAALGMEARASSPLLSGDQAAAQLVDLGALLSRSAVFWLVVISLMVVFL